MPPFNVVGFSHMLSLGPNPLAKCLWTQPCGGRGVEGMGVGRAWGLPRPVFWDQDLCASWALPIAPGTAPRTSCLHLALVSCGHLCTQMGGARGVARSHQACKSQFLCSRPEPTHCQKIWEGLSLPQSVPGACPALGSFPSMTGWLDHGSTSRPISLETAGGLTLISG